MSAAIRWHRKIPAVDPSIVAKSTGIRNAMDIDLAQKAVARIWGVMIGMDNPHTKFGGKEENSLTAALLDLQNALADADAWICYDVEQIRMALESGTLAIPQGKPHRETILRHCESLMKRLK